MLLIQSTSKKLTFFSTLFTKSHRFSSSQPPLSDESLVSAAVSILKHHRSKARWSNLRSLLKENPNFTSSQFSSSSLQIRNNPHLVLSFFEFTINHSLCSHSLSSYATVIHILARSRLKNRAKNVIKLAFCQFPETHELDSSTPVSIFEALIRTYRTCDSALFVFDLLVESCLESKKIDYAISVLRLLRSQNVFLRTSTCNSLIELVSKSGGCFAGYELYKEIFRVGCGDESGNRRGIKGVSPNVSTFNVIMVGFYREGLVDKVEELWDEMREMSCTANPYSYSVLMAAYCDDGRMEDAFRVWKEMENNSIKHDAVAYNTIIGGFCGIKDVERAEEFYREMVMSGMDSTSVTFEHLINAYCKIADVDSTMLLYNDMCRNGFSPESPTIEAIVRMLADESKVSMALEFWRDAAKKYHVVLMEDTYRILIEGLCQEGKMEEALKLQAEMAGKGYEPDSQIYASFIDGYTKQGNETMADKLRTEFSIESSPLSDA